LNEKGQNRENQCQGGKSIWMIWKTRITGEQTVLSQQDRNQANSSNGAYARDYAPTSLIQR